MNLTITFGLVLAKLQNARRFGHFSTPSAVRTFPSVLATSDTSDRDRTGPLLVYASGHYTGTGAAKRSCRISSFPLCAQVPRADLQVTFNLVPAKLLANG